MSKYPANIPDPTTDYPLFVGNLMRMGEPTTLQNYREAAGKNRRLWMVESSLKISMARRDGIVEPIMINVDGEHVNAFKPMDGASEFWKNGSDQSMTDDEILEGWRAMRTITDEIKKG